MTWMPHDEDYTIQQLHLKIVSKCCGINSNGFHHIKPYLFQEKKITLSIFVQIPTYNVTLIFGLKMKDVVNIKYSPFCNLYSKTT